MKQVVQSVRAGQLKVLDVPRPSISANEVLVRVSHSIVSAGTERAVRELASASLLGKAKARPDLVRQVIQKARNEGLRSTMNTVKARLDDDMPLGYSAAGTVLEVGANVSGITPGMLVATGGQGHAGVQAAAGLLTVPVPDGVAAEHACFSTVAAIAMQGLRIAEVGPGSRVCVIGLGLIGQLATRLALASGMEVVGIDLSPWAVERARSAGVTAFVESGTDTTEAVLAWSRGKGVDAVIVTAATPSSEPMLRAPALLRDRGIIAVVGDVGLELKRTPLYEKELSVRLARSYGPGRYDRAYEEWGVDYPPGFVPFSAARNMETFLNLVGSGRLGVSDLVTHSFPVAEADRAYEVIGGGGEPYLGVLLTFDEDETSAAGAPATKRSATHGRSAGLIGAGGFVRSVLYPAIGSSQLGIVTSVASKSGRSARYLADQHSLGVAESPEDLIADPHIDIVVVATPHDSHAELVCAALQAGKHVFCEKPLALSVEELEAVRTAWLASEGQLAVGFNRRHATAVREAVSVLAKAGNGPVVVTYRVNAGRLPQKHWYHDRLQGGRLVGEICHFVDTCQALTGSNEFSVTALGSGASEPILEEDLALLIRYTNGSTAAITYASGGHSAMEKEHVDIIGRGHSIRIVDFRQLFVDGHEVKLQSPDKGHTEQLRHFAKVLEGSEDGIASAERSIASMLATLNLAACLTQPIAAPGPAVG